MNVGSDLSISLNSIVNDLVRDGFSFQKNFFDPSWVNTCRDEIQEKTSSFKRAGIGKLNLHHVSEEIRKDSTLWWEMPSPTLAQLPYVHFFEALKNRLNEELFLGLWDLEGHYAIYEPGAFYKKHVDRFQNDSKRTVSLVTFFNENWTTEDGGLLILDRKNGSSEKILPEAGTLVIFMSDSIPHEVTPTLKTRYSFAGWFRTR